jgi:D-3-phosphoglycerate dehydrogenase / 2-oxoglutarate reductase
MARVLISDKLDKKGVALLRQADGIEVDDKPGLKPEEQQEIIGAYDGLIVRSATKVNAALLARATNLKLVIRAGIGVDNIDVPLCKERGVIVENTPRGNVVSAAEHAIALLLSMARQIPQASAVTKRGVWEKTRFMGQEITGKTLGIIGTGNIGAVVVDRAIGLRMKVIGFDPVLTADKAAAMGIELVSLDELFARADFITLHTPLLPSTRNIIDDAAFAKMKDGVLLVNAARGGLVDEDALLRAVESGKVAGAALDVFVCEPIPVGHPLLSREEIILTPHLGASTREAQVHVAVDAAEQMIAFFRDGTKICAL